jgi:type IV pilus assembly protein PilE
MDQQQNRVSQGGFDMNRFRRRKNQKGFTMIELMVVVVIVAILAAIAIPLYGKYIKNARTTEATGRMGELITAAKAWAQEHPDGSNNPTWPSGDNGIFNLSQTTENFAYTIQAGGGANANTTALTLRATGSNKMNGVTVDMTVANINANGSPPSISGL